MSAMVYMVCHVPLEGGGEGSDCSDEQVASLLHWRGEAA